MDEYKRGNHSLNPLPARKRTKRVGARSSKNRGSGKGGGFRKLFNWKWLLVVLLTTVLLVIASRTLLMQGQTVDLNKLDAISYSSSLLDNKGKLVAKMGKEKREFANIAEIEKVNPDLPEAFVKVEDARFYEHSGVDYYGLGRAVWSNIKSGGKGQGASTITMQVAGNVILENREKRYSRKIAEVATSLNLEKRYSKKKILEAYLNYIAFGNGMFGVKMAAKFYFNKDITKDKLEPHEIAYLAGIPKAPYTYNCFSQSAKKRAKAVKRRNVVLGEIAEDYIRKPIITQEEYQKAVAMPTIGCKIAGKETVAKSTKSSKNKVAAYKEVLVQEIIDRYNITDNDLTSKGYRIYTGFEQKVQNKMDEVLKDPASYKGNENLDGGGVTLNPKNGLITAIGGGRNYVGQGFLNHGSEVKKQPGSAIKPLSVYAPAIEKSDGKINENYILQDTPVRIGSWTPKNATGEPKGSIPMMETVKRSWNLSTINLLKDQVGLETAFKYTTKLGLKPDEKHDQSYAQMALGGLYNGVTAIQMAQAYSVFANNGTYVTAHTVERIEQDIDKDGKWEVVDPEKRIEPVEVFSKKTAYYMTRMLKEVIDSGTGTAAKLNNGRPVAGKTGTTNSGKEAYFLGYTPQYVTSTYIYNTSKDTVALSGGKHPAKMFKQIMDTALAGKPIKNFENPGVPEPPIPFQLKGPQLSGSYDRGKKAIVLNWGQQGGGGRVLYDLYRDGQLIKQQMATNGYVDTNIDTSDVKSYTYKVVATDTQTKQTSASAPVTVKVTIQTNNNPPDCNDPANAQKPECQNQQPPDCNDPANAQNPECQNQQPPDCNDPVNAQKPECQNQQLPDCNDPANAQKPECQNQNEDEQNQQNNTTFNTMPESRVVLS